MPKKPTSALDKEEAKAAERAEAAARLAQSKAAKDGAAHYVKIAAAVAVGLGAVWIVTSNPALSRKGANPKLEAYVVSEVSVVNKAAGGNFTAVQSPFFKWWTNGDVKYGLGGISVSSMVGMAGAVQYCASDEATESGAIPPSYDARTNWAMCFSETQDSGNCSASYAIAAADVLATRFCMTDNVKYAGLRLSSQQILSCDKKSQGCKGGGVDSVFAYMQRRGLYPEKCLPYVGEKGTACKTECKEEDKLKVLEHCVLTREKAIKREIYNRGPVVAPLYLKKDYLLYGSGVYTPTPDAEQMYDQEGSAIMHAVSVLGWGKSQGNSYWIVKHAWGKGWGEDGYARVSVGSILREGHAIVGVAATEQAIQEAEQKKGDEEKAKEQRKKERVERDERIAENRKRVEAEKAAADAAGGEGEAEASDAGAKSEAVEEEVTLD